MDSDLRTKLEALVNELENERTQAYEMFSLRFEQNRFEAAQYSNGYGNGYSRILYLLRALLAEDAADG